MPLELGVPAPPFRLQGIDNAFWVLGEPDRRRSVLLVFFHRESSTSRLMLPFVERLHRRGRNREAEIFGICLDNHRDALELAEDYTITFPVLIEDVERTTFQSYAIEEVPTIYRLDATLRIADLTVGWSRDEFEHLGEGYLADVDARIRTVWEENDLAPDARAGQILTSLTPRAGSA